MRKMLLLLLSPLCLLSSEDSTPFITGESLFFNRKIVTINALLANRVTAETIEECFKVIDPHILQRSPEELAFTRLNIIDSFALNTILDKLLKRCEGIIANPLYNLAAEPLASQQPKESATDAFKFVQLKSFEELENEKNKYQFAKLYRFFIKTLSFAEEDSKPPIPNDLLFKTFLEGPGPIDCFYQRCGANTCQYCNYNRKCGHFDSLHEKDSSWMPTTKRSLNLQYFSAAYHLAKRADFIQSEQTWFNKNRHSK